MFSDSIADLLHRCLKGLDTRLLRRFQLPYLSSQLIDGGLGGAGLPYSSSVLVAENPPKRCGCMTVS